MASAPLYTGRRVTIRRVTPDDAGLLHGWLQDPSFAAYQPTLMQICASPGDLAGRIALLQSLDPPVEIEAMVLHRPTGAPIGIMSLAGIDLVNRKAELSLAFRRGRGTRCVAEAVAFALESAFSTLNLRKVIFHVAADNAAVLRMARRYGAVEEGCLREEVARGEAGWSDLYRFAFWRHEWEAGSLRPQLTRVAPVTA